MKRVLLITVFGLLLVGRSFSAKNKDLNVNDFPLTLHITAIDVQQGTTGVTGGGSTDSNGNYSSSVRGGESYTWGLYTARIEGDPLVYGLNTDAYHDKAARWMLGYSSFITARANRSLDVGDYKARWVKGKDRELEILFTDKKGELKYQAFHVISEHVAETAPQAIPPTQATTTAPIAAPTAASATPFANPQQSNVRVEPAMQTSPQPVRDEESLGDAARRTKQHKACLELAKDNPSITCK